MTDTDSRTAQAQRAVKNHMLAALGVGLMPLPWLDLAALTGLQINLVRTLAGIYGVAFSAELGRSAVGALLGGSVPVSLSANLGRLAKGIPGIGWAVGGASVALLGAASTYALGRVFVQHFESGSTLLTFDPQKVRAYYAQQYEKGKEEVKKSFAGLRP
jgi:uncharacterized protein (DUF697 family)